MQRFVWHYLEMVLAMSAGMLLLAQLGELLWPGASAGRADLHVLAMASNMAAGVVVWMLLRRLPWAATVGMVAATYVPFLVMLVPYYLGAVGSDVLTAGAHVLMLPCMFFAMRGLSGAVRRGGGSDPSPARADARPAARPQQPH